MEWVTNYQNPETVKLFDVECIGQETPWQAYERWKKWINQFVIGEPKANEKYSVSDLKNAGLVGLYNT